MDAPKLRRWFRFSLRTMFVVIVLLSIPLSWIGYHRQWMHAREIAYRRLHHLHQGGFMTAPPAPPWPLWLFGATKIDRRDWRIRLDESDPEVSRLRELFPELQITSIKRFTHDQP